MSGCGCTGFNEDDIEIKSESKEYKLIVDKNGFLNFPDALKKIMGFKENGELRVVLHKDRIELFPNIHSLAKVYIEPTTLCNLMCRTCVRNSWDESMGHMSIETFDKLIEQLQEFKELQSVMFGGFGEPTFHKDILYMIGRVKSLGIKAEMVSNGTLLDESMINGLFENKLDTLWVSFDGSEEYTFENIRKGANYNNVIESLYAIKKLNKINDHKIKIGITFVAMKENINNLSDLYNLARIVGASMISISNVIPYKSDMIDQMLCDWSISFNDAPNPIAISLPLIDINRYTKEPLYDFIRMNNNVSIMNNKIGTETSKCKFIKERCTFIRWDGMVSTCMGLLHTNVTYPYIMPNKFEREVKEYILGNLNAESLESIWNSEEYKNFRDKVDSFDFSPCLRCGPCDLAESNTEDCFGNTFPTCGGCLWAQGIIQCP